jgi:uncharacterized protein YdaU (DUF1376 family)
LQRPTNTPRMHKPNGVKSSDGFANNLPIQQVIVLCPHYTTRPKWVKFSFPDLFGSLKWRRMTLEQKGAYIVLLGEQAINGPLPTDSDDLACIVACSSSNVTEADFLDAWKSPLAECFVEHDGSLINPRMAEELSEYSDITQSLSDKRSAAGRAGAAKREENRKQNQASASKPKQASSKAKQTQATVDEIRLQETTVQDSSKKVAKAPDALASAFESYSLSGEPWMLEVLTEYKEHRKEIKAKPLTQRGWQQKLADLAKYGEHAGRTALASTVSNGWLGLFPDKVQHAGSQAPSRGSWYKGPALHKVERNGMLSDIHMHYKQQAQNWSLSQEEALRLARAENHPIMHRLDWMEGARNDAPPLNGTPRPTILEITNEPPH